MPADVERAVLRRCDRISLAMINRCASAICGKTLDMNVRTADEGVVAWQGLRICSPPPILERLSAKSRKLLSTKRLSTIAARRQGADVISVRQAARLRCPRFVIVTVSRAMFGRSDLADVAARSRR